MDLVEVLGGLVEVLPRDRRDPKEPDIGEHVSPSTRGHRLEPHQGGVSLTRHPEVSASSRDRTAQNYVDRRAQNVAATDKFVWQFGHGNDEDEREPVVDLSEGLLARLPAEHHPGGAIKLSMAVKSLCEAAKQTEAVLDGLGVWAQALPSMGCHRLIAGALLVGLVAIAVAIYFSAQPQLPSASSYSGCEPVLRGVVDDHAESTELDDVDGRGGRRIGAPPDRAPVVCRNGAEGSDHAHRRRNEHALGELDEPIRVAPLVVVPGHDLYLGSVDHRRQAGIEDRRVRGLDDVAGGDKRILAVGEDAFELPDVGALAEHRVDLLGPSSATRPRR